MTEPIINDSSSPALFPPAGLSKGLIPRDYSAHPFGGLAAPFDMPTIPRSEWADRIREMETTQSRLSDICAAAKGGPVECKDQNGTNYCWAAATVHCCEVNRASQGLPTVKLSTASVAAPVMGFRNRGGYGVLALERIREFGIAPESMWPGNAIDRQYESDECAAVSLDYQTTEWTDVPDWDAAVTLLLNRVPLSCGYNWWGHQVAGIDLVILDGGEIGLRIRNSWSSAWGENGYGILTNRKASVGDYVAPRVMQYTGT